MIKVPQIVKDHLGKDEPVEKHFRLNSVFWSNAEVFATPNRLIVKRRKKIETIANDQISDISLIHKRKRLLGFIGLVMAVFTFYLWTYLAFSAFDVPKDNTFHHLILIPFSAESALTALAFAGFKYIEIDPIAQEKPYSLSGNHSELESLLKHIKSKNTDAPGLPL